MSKYAGVIQKARSQEEKPEERPEESLEENRGNQKNGKPESQKASKPEASRGEKEEEVNLSIKVPKRLRRHWVAEAKRHDTTITAAVIDALKSKFGEPIES